MAGALAKNEGAVGVLAVLEGGRERAIENEARVGALDGGKRSWKLFSEFRGEEEVYSKMAVENSMY